MPRRRESATPRRADSTAQPNIIDDLEATLGDPDRRHEASGLLRGLTRMLFRSAMTMRQEQVEPYEHGLLFISRRLTDEVTDEYITLDTNYLMGRVDSLLDLAGMAIDQSLSGLVIQQARRAHGQEILQALLNDGDSTPTELAERLGIKQSHLSNILRWMEATDLIRRISAGRNTIVTLGPKGEAIYTELVGTDAETNATADRPAQPRSQKDAMTAPPESNGERLERGEVATWLLRDDTVVEDIDAAPAPETLLPLFQNLPASGQEQFKAAVVDAIGQWRAGVHSQSTLVRTGNLAYAIGATEAIPVLRALIVDERVSDDAGNGARTVAELISIIARFHAVPQARHTLQRLFWDERFSHRYADEIFLGLCASEPERFPQHLVRYLSIERHEFDGAGDSMQMMLHNAVSTVGWQSAFTLMREVPQETATRFIHIIGWSAIVDRLREVSHDAARTLLRSASMQSVLESLPYLDRAALKPLLQILLDTADPLLENLPKREDGEILYELTTTDHRIRRAYSATGDQRLVHVALSDIYGRQLSEDGIYTILTRMQAVA